MIEFVTPDALSALLKVIFIDLVLAGDNAIVIGLAAAGLPAGQRAKAILVGIAAATLMHITAREMKEGPSGSAIRELIPNHRELLRSIAVVVSVAENRHNHCDRHDLSDYLEVLILHCNILTFRSSGSKSEILKVSKCSPQFIRKLPSGRTPWRPRCVTTRIILELR